MSRPISPESARLKMADLCAHSERCEYEIREKLQKTSISASDVEKIVKFLIENKFIDNARYAHSFANDKVRFAGWGRNKIRQALALKRISSENIRSAMEEIDEKSYETAIMKVAEIKSRNLDLSVYEEKTKLFRHLASRGFESDIISKTIRFYTNKQKEDCENDSE